MLKLSNVSEAAWWRYAAAVYREGQCYMRNEDKGLRAWRTPAGSVVQRLPGQGILVLILMLATPVLAFTTDPVSPIDTGTPIDIHCQNEPSSNVMIFYLTGDTSQRFGSESSCPTLGFRQLSALDGYFVEIDKTQLAGDEDTLSLDALRNDPGYVSETHVQWVAPTPAPSPTASGDTP